jgi:hypothetical protein
MENEESVEYYRQMIIEWVSKLKSEKAIYLIYGFVGGLIKRGEK